MSVFLTDASFKHGATAYNVHRCRCDICKSGKEEIRQRRKKRLVGVEPPEHGTSQSYGIYGCRCDVCRKYNRKNNREYREKLRGKEPPRHGMTGYDVYGCRCETCVSAKNRSHMKRRNNPKIVIHEKERGWRRIGIKNFTYIDFCRKYDEQNGRCAICGDGMANAGKKSEVAQVDHDHNTGKVRALLCHNCNKMLGFGRESNTLRLGAEYLDCYNRKECL